MLKALKSVLLAMILVPALLVTVLLGLAFYVLEKEPLVPEKPPVNYATIVAGKDLLKRINQQIGSAHNEGITVVISERELENLARMGAHTFDWFSADSKFDSDSIYSRVSVQLPANPLGNYLNTSIRLDESSEGIHVDRMTIGPLAFSGRWLLPLAARLADMVLGDQQASLLLASVRGMQLNGSTAEFIVYPPPNAKAHLKQAVRELQASRFPSGEQERVVYYYNLLAQIGKRSARSRLSLNAYLTPLMQAAARYDQASSAVAENRAAIWALSSTLAMVHLKLCWEKWCPVTAIFPAHLRGSCWRGGRI